jgi:hypothetical protein
MNEGVIAECDAKGRYEDFKGAMENVRTKLLG